MAEVGEDVSHGDIQDRGKFPRHRRTGQLDDSHPLQDRVDAVTFLNTLKQDEGSLKRVSRWRELLDMVNIRGIRARKKDREERDRNDPRVNPQDVANQDTSAEKLLLMPKETDKA